MPTPILVLATGGTFDKVYDPLAGVLVFGSSHAPAVLAAARCQGLAQVQALMMKDSLEMTDADRACILRACAEAQAARIVLIHGTDTLVLTARFLAAQGAVALAGKTVVLTGAMVPHAIDASESAFNLGAALAFAQTLPPGVHVAMNGRALAWDRAVKNRALGVFEEA